MRILVTGSSGRIGSAIARRLEGANATVVGLDARPGPWTSTLADVCDRAALRSVLHGVDAVIHVASLHAPHVGVVSRDEFRRVNVDGVRGLLEACVDSGVRRLVYTSTTSLYGHSLEPRDEAVWVTESLEPDPRDIYDETKLEAEELCREACRTGLTCVSLRISRCFPEPEAVVAGYRLHRGVDVRDVAEAHVLSVNRPVVPVEPVNISARSPFQREDCIELLHDAPAVIRRRVPWAEAEFEKRRWALPRSIDRVYVIDKAERLLGYLPRFGLRECLGEGETA